MNSSATFPIVNARWITPDGGEQSGTIIISEGRIERLLVQPSPTSAPDRSSSLVSTGFDAAGMLILPGLIDPHVHFRQPGQKYKEGIRNGSLAALQGGVTTILEMPNTRPPTTTTARFAAKQDLYRAHSLINWGLFLQATATSLPNGHQAPQPIDRAAALKIYMARSSGLPAVTAIEDLRVALRRGARVAVHAEDETCFTEGSTTREKHHHHLRPRSAIISALQKLEAASSSLSRIERPRLILCHLSTREEIAWVKRMRDLDWDIRAETCPHYLLFTQDDLVQTGSRFKVNPPLREAADREALCQAVKDGTIDFLATDHAPHSPAEKQSGSPPSGIAGIEWFGPFLLFLREHLQLDWETVIRLGAAGAADAYDLQDRGQIREGAIADFTLFSPTETGGDSAPSSNPVTKAGWNPFTGLSFPWRVGAVFLNGRLVFDHDRLVDSTAAQEVYGNL